MVLVISIFTALYIWLLYEVWRAPTVREEADGSITYLEDAKNVKDFFKSK